MNKEEYISELSNCLKRLPESDKQKALEFYREYLEEAGQENETSTIEALGTPKELAKKIIVECVDKNYIKEELSESNDSNINNDSSQGEDVSFTSINLTNHFGDINVTGDFEADNLDIVNDSGDVYLTGLSGAMIVELNFGDLTIEDSTFESLDIDNQSGDCTMDNVEIAGNTSISNEFGNSEASNCSLNEITANMECGDLDFINCVYSANVNIEESFGDVSVEGECTTDSFGFDLDASFGDISVQGN